MKVYIKVCDPLCDTCTNDLSHCLTCIPNLNLELDLATNSCKCKEGYYMTISSVCELCHETCKTCTGGLFNNCLTCAKDNYFVLSNVCIKCHYSCATCNG